MSEILWQPSQARVATSNLTHFTEKLSQATHTSFPDYQALHRWSIEHLEAFWEFFLNYTGVIYSKHHTEVLSSYQMPGARWFTGMELNYAENLLRHDTHGVAIRAFVEAEHATGRPAHIREISFPELRALVARCAEALAKAGIARGDRVAGYVANVPEAIVACLACASLGAVWSSASPDFGLEALCDRFRQVQPRLVFATTHYRYGGKTFSTKKVVQDLKNRLPSVEHIVAIPYPVDRSDAAGDVMWEDFLAEAKDPELKFEQVPFEHPLFILFSSGTTGAPKCMVHGTGGTLLQHRKELQLHCDLKAGDSLLFFTTCGWMMWNWQLSALSLGTTICLFDGNPGHPALSAIWQVVDQNAVTHFGTSGRFLESCMKARPPLSRAALGSFGRLRTLMYTGSPLSGDGFRWVYQNIKTDLHLAGISGGTDIVSCFVLGNPNLPVCAGEIQCKGLGVDVVALDDTGEVLENQPGELVCRRPLPSMPTAFLHDPDGKKYRKAYFDVYPGLWYHGDFVEFTSNGGVIIYGRSDATLNPGGVRIGSAEIYAALHKLDVVLGAVVVGWTPPDRSDEDVVLLVVLSPGARLDEKTVQRIKHTIRESCSPRHVPRHIFRISAVPVTRSGKTVELSVKALLAGKEISNKNALANPEVLDEIAGIRTELLNSSAQ